MKTLNMPSGFASSQQLNALGMEVTQRVAQPWSPPGVQSMAPLPGHSGTHGLDSVSGT